LDDAGAGGDWKGERDMFGKPRNAGVLLVGCIAICLTAEVARAQRIPPAREDELVSLIPAEAVFFLERRGHEAVRQAFLASNLGKMAQDEAIKQFVHESRVRIGRMIVKQMFDLTDDDEIARHQKLLHQVLKPFWYNRCAMYVTVEEMLGSEPGLGFICLPGDKYRKECSDALDALMKVGLPPKGQPGTRQAFTYKSGTLIWRGVAKSSSAFKLPEDPDKRLEDLKQRSLFMVNWTVPMLLIATDLSAADAMESVMSSRIKTKADSPSLKAVMQKTALKDWAFRWHLDVEALMRMLRAKLSDEGLPAPVTAMGLDRIRGVGGTGGYADNVYTRMTYVDAPKAAGGLLGILKKGGSYKRAFSMVPSDATFCLAGHLDTKVLLKMVREILVEEAPPAQTRPTGATRPVQQLPERAARILKQLDLLAEASDGNAAVFVTDLQAMAMGMFGAGGAPVGGVLDLKDPAKATKAIEELVKLSGTQGALPDDEDTAPPRPKQYRNMPIRYAGEKVRLAILKDRVVVALGDPALKAAIDTALDKTGGFEPGSKGVRLAQLAGDGSAIFAMDLAGLAKLIWPMLMQTVEGAGEEFPLASLPSTNKMVRMLGPEIAVFQPDASGLLLKSRGKIPFATKMAVGFPVAGAGLVWMITH